MKWNENGWNGLKMDKIDEWNWQNGLHFLFGLLWAFSLFIRFKIKGTSSDTNIQNQLPNTRFFKLFIFNNHKIDYKRKVSHEI